MRIKVLIFALITSFYGCKRHCDLSLIVGEILRIPIEFNNFSISELHNTLVYRIDTNVKVKRDTFSLINIVFTNEIKSTKIQITDKDMKNRYGHYESYFNACDLVFDWGSGRDTLRNLIVLKSKKEVDDECHKDDPNVRIDVVSFIHKGKLIKKNETVFIEK